MKPFDVTMPLPGAAFGATVRLAKPLSQEMPQGLPQALADAGGLLLIPGLGEITRNPRLLVTLSYLFGPEVEDYRTLLTRVAMAHETVPEIFMVTNMVAGARPPPKPPDPPLTSDGKLPVQYPHRKGWHTDQSYRRPPPDISLFYAATPVAKGSGQTIFASGHLAYDALPADLRAEVEGLEGLHAQPGGGRSRADAEAGKTPPSLLPHQRSQKQPVVRSHPVTGRKALYLCESGQMDWFDGPFVGLESGPHGAGARLSTG
jgi:taurine dioxygenase